MNYEKTNESSNQAFLHFGDWCTNYFSINDLSQKSKHTLLWQKQWAKWGRYWLRWAGVWQPGPECVRPRHRGGTRKRGLRRQRCSWFRTRKPQTPRAAKMTDEAVLALVSEGRQALTSIEIRQLRYLERMEGRMTIDGNAWREKRKGTYLNSTRVDAEIDGVMRWAKKINRWRSRAPNIHRDTARWLDRIRLK